MIKRYARCAVFLALLLSVVSVAPSRASQPVFRTVTGCVIGGVLYSLRETVSPAGKRDLVAYPLKVSGLALSRYEGKKISIQGSLLPGDRFNPKPETLKVLGPCDRRSKAAISRH